MTTLDRFYKMFDFQSPMAFMVGVRRDRLLIDASGQMAPLAHKALKHLNGSGRGDFGCEFPPCLLEDSVGLCPLDKIPAALSANDQLIAEAGHQIGFSCSYPAIGPAAMVDDYPDPAARRQEISRFISPEALCAHRRIIGTQIHIGMPSHTLALCAYNEVIKSCDQLCAAGDLVNGSRRWVYERFRPEDYQPPPYANWHNYWWYGVMHGSAGDPLRSWHLIRISVRGTIEFRMFSSTACLGKIMQWATLCHDLCRQALK